MEKHDGEKANFLTSTMCGPAVLVTRRWMGLKGDMNAISPDKPTTYIVVQPRFGEKPSTILKGHGAYAQIDANHLQYHTSLGASDVFCVETKLLNGPRPSLYKDAHQVSWSVHESPWFGRFVDYYYPWIDHHTLGWLRIITTDETYLVYHDKGLDADIVTAPGFFPRMGLVKNAAFRFKLLGGKLAERRFAIDGVKGSFSESEMRVRLVAVPDTRAVEKSESMTAASSGS